MEEEKQALSDAQLAVQVQQGDQQAFVLLSQRYLRLIRSQAFSCHSGASPEVEDLFQEGLLGLYRAACTFQEEKASFRTYASACISNQMVSALRSHSSKKNQVLNESLPLEEALTQQEQVWDPEAMMEVKDHFQRLWEGMQHTLSGLEQKVLFLYLSGNSRKEIAKKAGISVKSCDNALRRVRSKIKNL